MLVLFPVNNTGSNVVRIEAEALRALAERIAGPMAADFDRAVDCLHSCGGRVVVTGSYHAAVFALARGITAIGLARSEYYADKFAGLFEQFGMSHNLVHLHWPDWQQSLRQLLERAWTEAASVKPELLAAANEQHRRSVAAYQRVMGATERLGSSA